MLNFLKEVKELFCGSDGKLSIRKLLGITLCIVGVILLLIAEPPTSDSWMALAFTYRGAIAIILSFPFFNMITAQNIKEIVKKE